ncbi:MAG: hypothetical protein JWP81_2813 [Ferruginibacter sp.]|nr:hypothetical protein [Ferruginibacter sp.]
MPYSTNKLLTIAECDQATSLATERKDDLEFNQIILGRNLTGQEKSTALTNASLIGVDAEIAGTEAAIAVMPDGDAKTGMQSKLRRLNDRRDNLLERQQKGGNVALLDYELDAALADKQLNEITAYMTAISTRKAAL